MPLVRRALKLLADREVMPQLGLLKSTLLQLDSAFSEREYGVGSFRDFVQKLAKAGLRHAEGHRAQLPRRAARGGRDRGCRAGGRGRQGAGGAACPSGTARGPRGTRPRTRARRSSWDPRRRPDERPGRGAGRSLDACAVGQ